MTEDPNPIRKSGFTLIELLAVVAVIAIVGTIGMVAIRGAQQDSDNARTRGTIKKIENILLKQYETFLNRELPIDLPSQLFQINPATQQPFVSAAENARIRRIAILDLMRLELPDRPSDLVFPPVTIPVGLNEIYQGAAPNGFFRPSGFAAPPVGPVYLGFPNAPQYPTMATALHREFYGTIPVSDAGIQAGTSPACAWEQENANAELLYAIIEQISLYGQPAIDDFAPIEIADTDGDNHNEFIDAFGNPIQWLRWPAGYPQLVGPDPLGERQFVTAGNQQDVIGRRFDFLDPTFADFGYVKMNKATNLDARLEPGDSLLPLVISGGKDGLIGRKMELREDYEFPFGSGIRLLAGSPYLLPTSPNTRVDRSYAEIQLRAAGGNPPLGVWRRGPNYLFPDPYFPRGYAGDTGFADPRVGSLFDAEGDLEAFEDDVSNLDLEGNEL